MMALLEDTLVRQMITSASTWKKVSRFCASRCSWSKDSYIASLFLLCIVVDSYVNIRPPYRCVCACGVRLVGVKKNSQRRPRYTTHGQPWTSKGSTKYNPAPAAVHVPTREVLPRIRKLFPEQGNEINTKSLQHTYTKIVPAIMVWCSIVVMGRQHIIVITNEISGYWFHHGSGVHGTNDGNICMHHCIPLLYM